MISKKGLDLGLFIIPIPLGERYRSVALLHLGKCVQYNRRFGFLLLVFLMALVFFIAICII